VRLRLVLLLGGFGLLGVLALLLWLAALRWLSLPTGEAQLPQQAQEGLASEAAGGVEL
jgi:hypothetical protein